MSPETYRALVATASALVNPEYEAVPTLHDTFAAVRNWHELAQQAEIHGLSVMLGRLAADGVISIPRELDLQLKALTIRHQKVLEARRIVLADVIDLFDTHAIEFAFLKGAALSQLVYEPPWLRPMRDIDLLVNREQAPQAQRLLREIGFHNEDHAEGYLYEHHHLPNSTRIQNGFTISLEVHHDALSGDVSESITLKNLLGNLRSFEFAGKTAHAFGHRDMLKHLCHHSFEPAHTIKLGSMVDMVLYAAHYADEIDWPELIRSQANVYNALRCIGVLISLPPGLQAKLGGTLPASWHPSGIGQGFEPLSQISHLSSRKAQFQRMFAPSQWWMHIFYRVPPEKSLLLTRWVRHPATVGKWLWRRYLAAWRSRKRS